MTSRRCNGRDSCGSVGQAGRRGAALTVVLAVAWGVAMADGPSWQKTGGDSPPATGTPPVRVDPHVRIAQLLELRRTEPERSRECLDELVAHYDLLIRKHPTLVEYPLSLADSLNELAVMRVDELDASLRRGELDVEEAARTTRQATVEAARATKALVDVIDKTKQRTAEVGRSRPDVVERNQKLLRDLTPLLGLFEADQQNVEAARRRYALLRSARNLYDAAPTPKTAEDLARVLVIHFDQPELVPDEATARLSEQWQAHMKLACKPAGALSVEQTEQLRAWYMELATSGQQREPNPQMLIRAHVYTRQSGEVGSVEALKSKLRVDEIERALVGLAWSREEIAHAHDDLVARLAYLFGEKPKESVAVAQKPAKADDDVLEATEEDAQPAWRSFATGTVTPPDRPGPDAIAEASDAAPREKSPRPAPPSRPTAAAAAATTSTHPYDWPKSVCPQCGREFFPGWKGEYAKCSRCRDGRRNIFDFGNNE